MKRIGFILLTALIFLACVPTPKQEFIVNKSDSAVEDKLNASNNPNAEQEENTASGVGRQDFPDRWDENPIAENEHLIVRAAADVRTRADGLYPVYRTRPAEITQETVENIAVRFLDKPAASSESLMTKEDWGRSLQYFLDQRARYEEWVAAGKPHDWNNIDEAEWTQEQIAEETNWYMEQIKNAPDTLTSQAVNDYSGLKKGETTAFKLVSGEDASIFFHSQSVILTKGCKNFCNVYSVYNYREDLQWKEGKYKSWMEPGISREDAEAICLSEAERLGFTGFAIANGYEATLFDSKGARNEAITGGRCFELKRDFDGYPQLASYVNASQNLTYGSDGEFAVNAFIPRERLCMHVSRDGLMMIWYEGPKDVSGLVNANAELLPFDEIKQRIGNALLACFPYENYGKMTAERNENSPRLELEIYDVRLSTFTLRVKDETNCFYEMPCWIVSYDCCDPVRGADDWEYRKSCREVELNDPNCSHDALIINAVDGSIVHTDYGY